MRNPSSSSSGIPCNCKRGARCCDAVMRCGAVLACSLKLGGCRIDASRSVGGRAGVVRAGGQGRTRSEGRGRMSIGLLAKMEVRVRGDVLARTGNLQRWKVKAGSTTSSSYVLADRKGLDDFPAPRPLTEPLWSFELRFEEKYGLAGGFSGNLGAKESHSPSTPPGPSGTASLRLSPGGIPSCPVHWTFVRPVLSGCRRVPSTLSVLSTPNGHWAEPPAPGQSLWWTAVEACVANQCTANHPSLVYNCAASPTSRSPRCHVCSTPPASSVQRCGTCKRGSACRLCLQERVRNRNQPSGVKSQPRDGGQISVAALGLMI